MMFFLLQAVLTMMMMITTTVTTGSSFTFASAFTPFVATSSSVPPRTTTRTAPATTTMLLGASKTAETSTIEEDQGVDDLSPREQHVVDFIEELSASDLKFRIVVVGNAGQAILESTQRLGPNLKVSKSPQPPHPNLLTVSSNDQSFEYHLKIGQVSTIAILEKPRPAGDSNNLMRLVRFLNEEGKSITSFIVAPSTDSEEEQECSEELFRHLINKYGNELKLGS
mmetsp:Transcript_20789/g.49363  ORF Transcript_20789/g.49363 Transcript_20789/m.49363 type:complete len:225 (+) Transcript_20789:31-705(+)